MNICESSCRQSIQCLIRLLILIPCLVKSHCQRNGVHTTFVSARGINSACACGINCTLRKSIPHPDMKYSNRNIREMRGLAQRLKGFVIGIKTKNDKRKGKWCMCGVKPYTSSEKVRRTSKSRDKRNMSLNYA